MQTNFELIDFFDVVLLMSGKKSENKPWFEFQIQTKKWPIGKVLFDYPVKTIANSLQFGELAPAAKSKYFR